jgi:hypothetical protein
VSLEAHADLAADRAPPCFFHPVSEIRGKWRP